MVPVHKVLQTYVVNSNHVILFKRMFEKRFHSSMDMDSLPNSKLHYLRINDRFEKIAFFHCMNFR